MPLRDSYEASMAKAIHNAKEGCRSKFIADTGPWLGPENMAIRQEARSYLAHHLPSVLVDMIFPLNEAVQSGYGDFVDAEYFTKVIPDVVNSVSRRALFRDTIMMAIGTDNLDMFGKLVKHYRSPDGFLIPNDYYKEFSEFRSIEGRWARYTFRQTLINVICYCGRGAYWLELINCSTMEMNSGFKYMLMGSGPVSELNRAADIIMWTLRPREDLLAIAVLGDANPEIIEFLKRF